MEVLLLRLKNRIGQYCNKNDDELLQLLEEAQFDILGDINNSVLPPQLEGTLIQWAIIKYNRIGTEGQNSENFSGTSSSYDNDFPPYIKRSLNRFRRSGKRRAAEVTP